MIWSWLWWLYYRETMRPTTKSTRKEVWPAKFQKTVKVNSLVADFAQSSVDVTGEGSDQTTWMCSMNRAFTCRTSSFRFCQTFLDEKPAKKKSKHFLKAAQKWSFHMVPVQKAALKEKVPPTRFRNTEINLRFCREGCALFVRWRSRGSLAKLQMPIEVSDQTAREWLSDLSLCWAEPHCSKVFFHVAGPSISTTRSLRKIFVITCPAMQQFSLSTRETDSTAVHMQTPQEISSKMSAASQRNGTNELCAIEISDHARPQSGRSLSVPLRQSGRPLAVPIRHLGVLIRHIVSRP